MKKFVSLAIALACTSVCLFAVSGCGGESTVPEYYDKTITFTGNALPIKWDEKCNKDNGSDNYWDEDKNSLHDNSDYSLRELLEKYWDKIDFEYLTVAQTRPWASVKGKTVDQFITEMNGSLNGLYNRYMDLSHSMKFEFGNKDNRTFKLTMLKDGEEVVYDTKFTETEGQLNDEKSKFDPKAEYLNWVTMIPQTGRYCVAFIDADGNGLYDGYVKVSLTAYIVNGEKPTMEIDLCFKNEVDENDGTYYSKGFSFYEISNELAFWGYPGEQGHTTLITLPLYPEIVLS